MTDAEIIKALECCVKNNNCEGCPLDYLTFSSQCASELAIKSLDLINRQKERIKTLTNSRDNWSRIAEEFDKASRETEKEVECLQAEIDELKHEREVLIEDIHHFADKINEQLEEIERLKYNLKSVLDERADHTDAIKEFAERLKLSFFNNRYESPDVDFDYFIDNLVKEMVGEE